MTRIILTLILATLFGLWVGSVITKATTNAVAVQLEYEQ